jgi:signal recognition particle receptor subunit beta
MARINPAQRTIAVKLVYYGPGLSGKTTNLVKLHLVYPQNQRGDLVKLDTETERTLFFDYFPASLGTIGGFRLKADFFTVPGQSFYNATRRAVLEGADGIVFVADSTPDREEANLVSLENMHQNLESLGKRLTDLPHVFQWNKRDVPGALPEKLLQRQLNPGNAPAVAAIASQGVGVWDTQGILLKSVLEDLRTRSREGRLHA